MTSSAFETAEEQLFEAADLDPETQFVRLEEPRARVRVFELGPTSKEPPLLFVHGGGAFGAFFAPLMSYLEDVRSIGFDRPGYGRSDPFVYTAGSHRRTAVNTLHGVLGELDVGRTDLVCHSMGGHAGILFALAHPERVRRLILVGSVPSFPGTEPPVPFRLVTVPLLSRLFQRLQRSGEEGVLDLAEIFGERDSIQSHPELIRTIAAHERDPKAAKAGLSELRSFIWAGGWRSSALLTEEELRALRRPTLMIWGDSDPLGLPEDVRSGVDSIPNRRFETIASGHVPFWRKPERCAELIREVRD